MYHDSTRNTKPVEGEEIHLWPAFLFEVFDEYIVRIKPQDLTLTGSQQRDLDY